VGGCRQDANFTGIWAKSGGTGKPQNQSIVMSLALGASAASLFL